MLGWVQPEQTLWKLTDAGRKLAESEPSAHPVLFARHLCLAHEERNARVVSRLLARMWELNPERQGAVPLPTPLTEGFPREHALLRSWLTETWSSWLKSMSRSLSGLPLSAPLESHVERLEHSLGAGWEGWSESQQRRRLAVVMTNRLLHVLFGDIVLPRDWPAWQRRLDWAGFSLLARKIAGVAGRVWFPAGAFRAEGDASFVPFQALRQDTLCYHVHAPSGQEAEERFAELLYDCFQARQQLVKAEYVSLHAVRDHVCYLFRIGNDRFEALLQDTFLKALRGELPFSMALEVDISPAELRRLSSSLPIIIDHAPRYIIAMRRRTISPQEYTP